MKNLIREGGKILTLRHMKIFTTVYRCGSVTRAAQELHLAQPSLSVAIRELEEQIICAKEQYEQLRQITMRLQEDGRRMRDYIRDRKKDHRP